MKRKNYNKLKIAMIFYFLVWIFIGCGTEEIISFVEETKEDDLLSEEDKNINKSKNEIEVIQVYICGAVVEPGVVSLPVGARMHEGINAVGGMREDAAINYVNLAAILKDEEQVYIPTLAEAIVLEETKKQEADLRININTASKEELMTLPGIGESRAQDIIAYRETVGVFKEIEDIMMITGIKTSVFDKIKNNIRTK